MSDIETETLTPIEETPEVVETPVSNVPKKLKTSERNKIIEDYKAGTIHPDYEIVTTKVAGKFIVKPRKQKLTEEQVKKVNITPRATEKSSPSFDLGKLTKVETIELPKPVVEKKKASKEMLELQIQINQQMMNEVGHLRKKIKKLKHRIFDEEEDTPAPVEAPKNINFVNPEEPEEEYEHEEVVPTYRRVRRADLLNYRKFGF
jgi:hypothetical protein